MVKWTQSGMLGMVITSGLVVWSGNAQAADAAALVDKINDLRGQVTGCDGRHSDALVALQRHEVLEQAVAEGVNDLERDLRAAGYRAAYAQHMRIQLSGRGAANAEQVFAQVSVTQCELLRQPHWQHIAVDVEPREWQIILAQPLLSQELGDWRQAGQEVLRLTNQAREQGQYCAGDYYPPAPALTWHDRLADAALGHSEDMAAHNYFSHEDRRGEHAAERIAHAGYRWRLAGENLASGPGSADGAVQGWLDSPSHCVNLMNPDFTQMGAAYATDAASDGFIYWTQKFASPHSD